MNSIDKKTWSVVTGATSGIGKAFAQLLASEGHNLVLVARNADELNRIAGVEISKNQCEVVPLSIDLTQKNAVEQLAAEMDKRGIVPDFIINNAGAGLNGAICDLDAGDQLSIIDLNVRAMSAVVFAFLPKMLTRGSGGIINISSMAAFLPGPYMAVYYASKAYVQSFTTSLRDEVKDSEITVMSVCPGLVDTNFQARAGVDTKRFSYKLMQPLSANEVAQTAWYGFKAGNRQVVPGIINQIAVVAAKILPDFVLIPIVRWFQKPKRD